MRFDLKYFTHKTMDWPVWSHDNTFFSLETESGRLFHGGRDGAFIVFTKQYYSRVSHLPQNTVSLALPVKGLLPHTFSMAARMLARLQP